MKAPEILKRLQDAQIGDYFDLEFCKPSLAEVAKVRSLLWRAASTKQPIMKTARVGRRLFIWREG